MAHHATCPSPLKYVLLIAALTLEIVPVYVPACLVQVPNSTGAFQISPEEALKLEFFNLDTKAYIKAQYLEGSSRGLYKAKVFLCQAKHWLVLIQVD